MTKESARKRGEVTDEHRKEAADLRSIWESDQGRAARRALGASTQEAFGEKMSIGNQSAVWQFMAGKTPLSLKAAIAFAAGLGCEVRDFSPRLAKLQEPPLSEGDGKGASEQPVERAWSVEAREIAAICDGYDEAGRKWLLGVVMATTQGGAASPPGQPPVSSDGEPGASRRKPAEPQLASSRD